MDMAREYDPTSSQDTQLRESQKIEKEVKMVSTSSDSEEMLKLRKNIQIITSLIQDKQIKINQNADKWCYKHYTELSKGTKIMFLALLVICLSLLFLGLNILNLNIVMLIMFSMVGFYFPFSVIFAMMLRKAEILEEENQTLSSEIDYLEEIKKQKVNEIEQIKQRGFVMGQPRQEVKTTSDKLEIYKEALRILQDMQKEAGMKNIEQVKGVIEQIKAKQKTLGTI